MKKLTLKELQAFALEMLKDVAAFCEKSGIRYSLGYGTLLGAVRHKGFIPWDDDIDVMMPRGDYERFRQEYSSDSFRFVDCRNTPGCYIAFGRVCDFERTEARTSIPWLQTGSGVWIDIFPVDRVPDDRERFERIYDSMLTLMKFNVGIRRVHTVSTKKLPVRSKMRIWLLKHTHPRLLKRDPADIVKDMDSLIGTVSREESHHYSQLCCPDYGALEYYSEEDIDEYVRLPFEDGEFLVWKGYDRILRDSYGDYLQLPPENKRKPLQNYISFYWKG